MDRFQQFICPNCQSAYLSNERDEFVCKKCLRHYPVINQIPRFIESLSGDASQVQDAFEFEHRRFQDSWYTRFTPLLVDQFLADCQLPADFFKGKRVLDAGCGSGRWTYALASLGAEVSAFDLTSSGLEAASSIMSEFPNICLYQADIFHTPFPPESFDFVMSWGVLHHTADTRAAFNQLIPLIRSGGVLYVMVYEQYSLVRQWGTDLVRGYLRRLPNAKRYKACRYLIIRNRYLARILNSLLIVSYYNPATSKIDPQTIQFGLYDAYSPRFNHLHTRDEVAGWFRENNFHQIEILDCPAETVKVRGIK